MARLIVLALVAAAALLAPAAALDCKGTVDKAMSLCKRQMVDVVFAAQAGLFVDAKALAPSQACCTAAAAVFDPAFMGACGCDAAVLANAVTTTPAALAALKDMVGDACRPAGELAGFPTCPAPAVIAAAKTAGVTYTLPKLGGDGSFSLASANNTNDTIDPALVPKAGHNSKCYVSKACSTRCNGTTAGSATAYAKALQKCRNTTAKGFCAGGYSRCGNNVTDNADLFTRTNTRTKRVETCFRCCQPGGDVYSEQRQRWYRNVNMCSKSAAACFPGDATVTLEGGASRAMSELQVGDRVRVLRADGSSAFEDVYFFDHQVGGGANAFVRIALAGGAALELSGGHFVPVGASLAAATMKRARDVAAGDVLLVLPAGAAAARAVAVESVAAVTKAGLFAPVTASGTVVVGGVVASTYSDWVLDPLFDALGAPHKLPAAMHAVHAPLRLAYALLGARAMRALSPLVSGVAMLDSAQIAAGLGLAVSAA